MERILYLALISVVAEALLPEGRLHKGVRAAVGLMAVRAVWVRLWPTSKDTPA